jgi:hypothetical protein
MAAVDPTSDRRKFHNYKLIADPHLHPESKQKIYRVDGTVDKAYRNQHLYVR